METKRKMVIIMSFVAFFLIWSGLLFSASDEYDAMKGIDSIKAIFDMRDGNPQSALIHLNLIHDTYKDLAAMKKDPAFVVVFMASAVKLLAAEPSGFKAEDQKTLKEIAGTLSQMSAAGIRIEVCLFAAKLFGVESGTILPEVKQLPNGWISEIGYQARGYSLVPVY